MGHVGYGSRGSWVTRVMGHMGHGSRGSLMCQFTDGSDGSWVTWVMGQFTDGSDGSWSQNVTHSQLWNRPLGNYRRGLQCQKPFTVSLSPLMQHSVGFRDLCYTKNNIRELDRRESFWFFGQFGSFCADVTPADTQKLSCRCTSAAEETNAGPRNCWNGPHRIFSVPCAILRAVFMSVH